jgi:hypothetical protein
MNKTELLKKIDLLLAETKINEANAKTDMEKMFFIGRQNGLVWARLIIIDLEEKTL